MMCSKHVRSEVPSEDGKRVATVSDEDCGALDGGVILVNVEDKAAWFGFGDKFEIMALGGLSDEVPTKWVGARVLEIALSRKAASHVLRQKWRVADISVSYLYAPGQGP